MRLGKRFGQDKGGGFLVQVNLLAQSESLVVDRLKSLLRLIPFLWAQGLQTHTCWDASFL
jgi:hypothetical protein